MQRKYVCKFGNSSRKQKTKTRKAREIHEKKVGKKTQEKPNNVEKPETIKTKTTKEKKSVVGKSKNTKGKSLNNKERKKRINIKILIKIVKSDFDLYISKDDPCIFNINLVSSYISNNLSVVIAFYYELKNGGKLSIEKAIEYFCL